MRVKRSLVVLTFLVVAASVLAIVNPGYISPVVNVVKTAAPAVVKIDVVRTQRISFFDPFTDEFFRKYFGETPFGYEQKVSAVGSGFIFDKTGFILTNEHVVHKAEKITVTLLNGDTYDAKYVGGDEELDIAVIKINPKGELPVLELGNSDTVEIGEWAIAIGNPLGLQHTVTLGVISALNRNIPKPDGSGYYTGLIQTDAAINPGNSGGPLLNIHGQVIGINTAIVNPMEGVNLGFAIPINTAMRFVDSLIETGRAEKAYLGVWMRTLTEDLAKALGIEYVRGVIVVEVIEGSPAKEAGIKANDVIIAVNGQKVGTAEELKGVIRSYPAGSRVTVTVMRDGQKLEIPVILGSGEESEAQKTTSSFAGINVREITAADRETYSIPSEVKGVIVEEVERNSLGSMLGVRKGDVVTTIYVNGRKYQISGLEDWQKATSSINKGDAVALQLYREGMRYYVEFRMK